MVRLRVRQGCRRKALVSLITHGPFKAEFVYNRGDLFSHQIAQQSFDFGLQEFLDRGDGIERT